MYAVVVKNDNNYDVVAIWKHNDNEIITAIDAAWNSGLPITSLDACSHKLTARYGATWNGSSFSGGRTRLVEPTQEQLDSFDLYAFICNNTLIARVAALTNSPTREMYAAAHASGMTLIKIPSDQSVTVGKTYTWDGNSFNEV
ncbi:MAG: hypothetical protein ACK5P0_01120 [bacterium]|jgi:hypothetical protein